MKRFAAFLSLFTSLSTLLCCALPALFVVLGLGATFAGFVGKIPGLIWVSEHKDYFFAFGALCLSMTAVLRYRARAQACDPKLAEACRQTRDWSGIVFWIALGIYLCGATFAYILPAIL